MKNLNTFIIERLKLTKDSKIELQTFSDEELMKDYDEITYACTKAEKLPIAKKYGVTTIRIKDIQQAILIKLRDNRHIKKDFTEDDVRNFFRLDVPERYNRMKEYLDQESTEFIEYLLEYLKEKAKKIRYPYLSYSDKTLLNRIKNIEKYVNEKP